MRSFLGLLGVVLLVGFVIQALSNPIILAAIASAGVLYSGYRLVRHHKMKKYFGSDEFLAQKESLRALVREHNEVKTYTDEIRERGTFDLGRSMTGAHAHLATAENTSRHNYKRDRNIAQLQAPNVHNCSLQVVRNAQSDPLKYIMKYFDLKPDERNLARVESLGESIGSLENAIENLKAREVEITQSINPPRFIMKHYEQRFMDEMGIELSPITITYPEYIFEYVSAGGNSGQKTTVELNPPTIDALIETMSERIRFRKSAAGQRALMTSRLRRFIKDRDDHTCQNCSVSIKQEPHLLLEVDHIVPVSLGGLTTEENLQTLCWKCNRTKSNKMPT